MLNTPIQRFSVLLFLSGLALFAFGAYQWFQDYRHHWELHTQYVPDYPNDYSLFPSQDSDGVIQHHRYCEWTTNLAAVPVSSADKPMRDLGYPAEPVVLNDNFLTIDHLCARQELALWQPSAVNYTYLPSNSTLNPFWDAELVGGFWKYENVVVDQASRSIAAWWGAGDSAKGQQSGQELYKALLKEKLEKVGFNPKASRVISEKCIKVERKSCVERSRTTRFNLLRIVAADSVMFSGMALVFIGLAGSVFFSPLCWVYTRSLGRLWKWVRHGH